MNATNCTCGCNPPHETFEECARNQISTGVYMRSINEGNYRDGQARGTALRAEHDTHLVPAYGCPRCPLDSRFRRESAQSPWELR
ncbi:MAG: hypothetical protein ACLQU5_09570 [Isosphaeraceae bacterium]